MVLYLMQVEDLRCQIVGWVNLTEQQNKFCLRLHYIGVSSYLFVNGAEI